MGGHYPHFRDEDTKQVSDLPKVMDSEKLAELGCNSGLSDSKTCALFISMSSCHVPFGVMTRSKLAGRLFFPSEFIHSFMLPLDAC